MGGHIEGGRVGIMLITALLWTGTAGAQPADEPGDIPVTSPPRQVTLGLHWENDGKWYKPNNSSDRYYTNGAGFTLAGQWEPADRLIEHMPFAEQFGPATAAMGLAVGQLMFTPEDLSARQLIVDDRPYAGHLFAGVYWQRAGLTGDGTVPTLDHFQLDLGVVGPSSLAERAQIAVHEFTNEPRPMGWSNQLRDEPTIQLTVRKKWRLTAATFDLGDVPLSLQLIPEIGASLGTVHRHLEGGATMRFGYNLPDDFGPGRLLNPAAATGIVGEGWSVYGFARATGRAVQHNLFIDGSDWRSSHSVDRKPLVGEVQVGVALTYHIENFTFSLNYSQTFVSEEFKGQRGSHSYGAYNALLTCWF